jgi:hypothetical protein
VWVRIVGDHDQPGRGDAPFTIRTVQARCRRRRGGARRRLDASSRRLRTDADGLAYGTEAYNTGLVSMQGAVARA